MTVKNVPRNLLKGNQLKDFGVGVCDADYKGVSKIFKSTRVSTGSQPSIGPDFRAVSIVVAGTVSTFEFGPDSIASFN